MLLCFFTFEALASLLTAREMGGVPGNLAPRNHFMYIYIYIYI